MTCDKCNTVNPPIKTGLAGWHHYTKCRKIIGFRYLLFGWIVKPIYCNYIIQIE